MASNKSHMYFIINFKQCLYQEFDLSNTFKRKSEKLAHAHTNFRFILSFGASCCTGMLGVLTDAAEDYQEGHARSPDTRMGLTRQELQA